MLIALIKLTVQEGGNGGHDGEVVERGWPLGHPCPWLVHPGLRDLVKEKGRG